VVAWPGDRTERRATRCAAAIGAPMTMARHRRVSRGGLATLALLVACGRGAGMPRATPESVELRGPRSTLRIDLEPDRVAGVDTIGAPPARVWDALPRVLAGLGMAVDQVDADGTRVTTRLTQFRRELAGTRLSRMLHCGVGPVGDNADSYFVSVRVQLAMVRVRAQATMVEARVSAAARPPDNGATAVRCTSTGLLEQRVLELVAREALATHGG
jgi:hypothetical protein